MSNDIWEDIRTQLEHGKPLAVATIVTADGSTPRNAGAKILVGENLLLAGTLGGGLAEAQAIGEAEKTLQDGKPRLFTIDMSATAASGADLICGGSVRIFVQQLTTRDQDTFRQIAQRKNQGLASFLITPLAEGGQPQAIALEDAEAEIATTLKHPTACLLSYRNQECLLEPIPAPARLILAGGGHVSLATARMATEVGFEVSVIDDREEFVAPARFSWLSSRCLHAMPGFKNCLDEQRLGFPITPACFIAILTRGHSYDATVLAAALATPAGYIGMIGSRRKRDQIYASLRTQGCSQADLDKVYSPIGLAIAAETPEEIAVSIVAELIAVRAKQRSD